MPLGGHAHPSCGRCCVFLCVVLLFWATPIRLVARCCLLRAVCCVLRVVCCVLCSINVLINLSDATPGTLVLILFIPFRIACFLTVLCAVCFVPYVAAVAAFCMLQLLQHLPHAFTPALTHTHARRSIHMHTAHNQPDPSFVGLNLQKN